MDIPWKPLSIGGFLFYTRVLQEKHIPDAIIEDEIFIKCVTASDLTYQIDTLEAGIVSLVAREILARSGPSNIEEFNEALETARIRVSSPLNEIVLLIIQAFPSYKLEDVYAMEFETIMERLAQAEILLMKSGQLKEPLSMLEDKPKQKRTPRQIKEAWAQAERQSSEIATKNANSTSQDRKKRKEVPEVAMMPKDQLLQKHDKIDFSSENKELFMSGGITGDEMVDEALIKYKALQLAEKVHPKFQNPKK